MEAILKNCAGFDIHWDTIGICTIKSELNKKPESIIMTYDADTESCEVLRSKWVYACSHGKHRIILKDCV